MFEIPVNRVSFLDDSNEAVGQTTVVIYTLE